MAAWQSPKRQYFRAEVQHRDVIRNQEKSGVAATNGQHQTMTATSQQAANAIEPNACR